MYKKQQLLALKALLTGTSARSLKLDTSTFLLPGMTLRRYGPYTKIPATSFGVQLRQGFVPQPCSRPPRRCRNPDTGSGGTIPPLKGEATPVLLVQPDLPLCWGSAPGISWGITAGLAYRRCLPLLTAQHRSELAARSSLSLGE